MRGVLTANTFFNTVALARQAVRTLILVVEGDDDHFVVKDHVNDTDVLLIKGVGGRPAVLDAAVRAEALGMRGVRFLIDVDYDRFTNPTSRYPANVVASKHHDAVMDMVVVSAGLLDRVVESHTRGASRRGVSLDPALVRKNAFKLAAAVAPLRIVNDRNAYGISLKKFPFGALSTISPTPDDLAAAVADRAKGIVSRTDLAAQIAAETSHLGLNREVLVGDHDYFRALSRVIQMEGAAATADALWTSFLVGVLCEHLARTDWYDELTDWGTANSRATFACPHAA